MAFNAAYDPDSFSVAKVGFTRNLRMADDVTVRDHAEKNLYLAPGKNPFPGLVDFSKTPYLFEPLDALAPAQERSWLSPPPAEIVFPCAATIMDAAHDSLGRARVS